MAGDLYPLVVPPAEPPPRRSDFGHVSVYDQMHQRWNRACRARHSVQVVNACATGQACRVNHSATDRARPATSCSRARLSVLERVHRRIAAFGRQPSLSPLEAVNELLRTSSVDEPRPSTLAAFDWQRLKLLDDYWTVRPQAAHAQVTASARSGVNPDDKRSYSHMLLTTYTVFASRTAS